MDNLSKTGRIFAVFFLTLAFFVSPILFFTDLTRNPYYFQITVLNSSILSAGILFAVHAVKNRRWEIPKNVLTVP
ncbi:MAG: hypothetical protein HY746_08140 [Elusimicrobia bacterium]|nr:hypothetical protein [Elusimicrobiota bacterium]